LAEILQYGIDNYSINELAVNEQNPLAKAFYETPYPLLYMKRNFDTEY
jgi:putative acetyltransferase